MLHFIKLDYRTYSITDVKKEEDDRLYLHGYNSDSGKPAIICWESNKNHITFYKLIREGIHLVDDQDERVH